MKSKWNIFLFVVPIFALFLLNILVPNKNEVSVLEKRDMQKKPTFSAHALFDGSYLRDYDNYFSDHFVFRDFFLPLGSSLKAMRGFKGEDGASLVVNKGGNNGAGPLTKPAPTPGTGSDSPSDTSVPANGAVSTPKDQDADSGGLVQAESEKYLIIKDRGMSLYQYSAESATAYANAVNTLQKSISPDIKVYSLLVPSSIEFLGIEKYKKMSDSQLMAFQSVDAQFNSQITPVDAYGQLNKHKDEYIYFKTDHHWTALGAYYSYTAFMDAIGQQPIPLSRYEKSELKNFLGSTYAATLNTDMKKSPDTITLYKPFTPHKASVYWKEGIPIAQDVIEPQIPTDGRGGYAVFLGGDFPQLSITTNVNNGKRLLVLKDSYANALVPFLLPHYAEITVIDPRYYQGNVLQLIKKQNITDVLLINSSIVTTYSGIADLLKTVMGIK